MLLTVALVVVVALAGGGYLLVKHFTGDETRGQPVAGQLRGLYPEKPSAGWQLNAETVFADAEFVRPDPTSNQYQRPGFIDLGDTLLTSAILPRTDRGATLVAVDSDTGAIRWTADAGFTPVCASATVDGLIPCLGREATFGASAAPMYVSFLSMADGSIDHRLQVPDLTQVVEVSGSAVYTMGYEDGERTITRGNTDDLTADWSRRYPVGDDTGCPGSGDASYHGIDHAIVYSGNDGGMTLGRDSDGEPLTAGQVTMLSVFDGQGFTARSCSTQNPDMITTIVADSGGELLRTVTDKAGVARPWLVGAGATLPYVIGRTAYDFSTGRPVWTAAGNADLELHTIVGDTVLGGDYRVPLTAFDIATGERLWTSDITVGAIDLSDGQHIMAITDRGLTAVDLATGATIWTLPGVEDTRSVAQAGQGFAHVVGDSITYYGPTGGPAVAPGRSGAPTPAVDTNAGGLITKCGRTPEMRPVRYRAENGSLMVTMEIKARCPGGDILSTDRLRVTVRDQLGRICSAVFDFSNDPVIVGGDGAQPTTVELEFVNGTFTRHPNTLGENAGRSSGTGGIVTESTASGLEVVDCEEEGTGSVSQTSDKPSTDARRQSVPAPDPAAGCGSDEDVLAALRAQVDADRPFVQAQLADRWVAQLSSKRPGLVAPDVDGRMVTWSPCEILQQHLRMRGQYPEVRLVWSDEWRTFDLAGWWVTFAGLTFPDADAANGWCDARAIPVDECFAKIVSSTRDSSGSTKYRR
ncbi:MAG: PQQ-binding-like beta-propeller repeat protein [Actinomycetota bacterium]